MVIVFENILIKVFQLLVNYYKASNIYIQVLFAYFLKNANILIVISKSYTMMEGNEVLCLTSSQKRSYIS